MATIIKNKVIAEADWQRLTLEQIAAGEVPNAGKIMVPLAYWKQHRETLLERPDGACVWLDAGEEAAELENDIPRLDTIGLYFPLFNDGRGYSCARELRRRYAFKGDLVALGDVLRDQLFYMQRCGINVFEPRADRDINEAQAGLFDFSLGLAYQGDVRDPRPIYRRWSDISFFFGPQTKLRKLA